MHVRARYNDLTCLSVFLASSAFLVADEKPVLLTIAAGAVAVAWIGSRGSRADRPWALPHAAINLLVVAAISSAAFKTFVSRDDPYVSVLGQFFVLLSTLKLFDRRTPRDDAQILWLSICTGVAAVLTAATLLMGILLLLFAPAVIAATMLWQINAGLRRAQIAAEGARPAGSVITRSVSSIQPGLAAPFTGALVFDMLICALVAAGVFIFAPRGLQVGPSAGLGLFRGATSGFSEQIQLGREGLLSENTTPVLDVQFTDSFGVNLGSSHRTFYLRASTRSEYDPATGAWNPPGTPARNAQHTRTSSHPINAPADSTMQLAGPESNRYARDPSIIIQDVHVRPTYERASKYAFAVWRPVTLTPTADVAVTRSPEDSSILLSQPGRGFARTDSLNLGYRYTISSREGDPGDANAPLGPLAFGTGRVHDLGVDVLRQAGITLESIEGPDPPLRKAINALCEHVRNRCTYTLELVAPPSGEDPIEYFLFDRKQGHCEYFASALVALCQSVGIHSRLVIGYVATDFNDYTGRYIVRESHAHAWVEAHIGSHRWATFDPTPPADLDRIHRPSQGSFSRLKRWWDALEVSWSASIVSFDQRTQSSLLGKTAAEPSYADRFGGRDGGGLVRWFRARARLGDWWKPVLQVGLPGILGLAAAYVALREIRRRARIARVLHLDSRSDPELRRLLSNAGFYAESLAALDKAGLAKPDARPPLAHALSLLPTHPEQAETLRRVGALYYRLRFERKPLTPEELTVASELAHRLGQARPKGR